MRAARDATQGVWVIFGRPIIRGPGVPLELGCGLFLRLLPRQLELLAWACAAPIDLLLVAPLLALLCNHGNAIAIRCAAANLLLGHLRVHHVSQQQRVQLAAAKGPKGG